MSDSVLFYGTANFFIAYFAMRLILAIVRGRITWTTLDRIVAINGIVFGVIFINLVLRRLDLFGAAP